MISRSQWRIFAVALICVAIVCSAWAIRTAQLSWTEFEAGQFCETQRDFPCATLRYRHALELYTPFGSASRQGLDGLIRLASMQAGEGDVEGALVASRSARIGVLAIRHPLTPFAQELPALERTISRLAVSSEHVEEHAQKLAASRAILPRLPISVAIGFLLIGFLGFSMLGVVTSKNTKKPSWRLWLWAMALVCLVSGLCLVALA